MCSLFKNSRTGNFEQEGSGLQNVPMPNRETRPLIEYKLSSKTSRVHRDLFNIKYKDISYQRSVHRGRCYFYFKES